MKATQQAIERGVKDCLFIDYKRRSGHFDVTTVASIKEISEKVRLTYSDSVTVDIRLTKPAKVNDAVLNNSNLSLQDVWILIMSHDKTF